MRITIRGGYSPNIIELRQGVPAEIEFDRQESGDCSARVVFPDLQLSAALPAHQRTTVRLTPNQAGSFGFACGMNMIHGTLVVAPNGHGGSVCNQEPPNEATRSQPRDGGDEAAAADVEAAQSQ